MRIRSPRGFTLTELMIAVAIVGVLASVAIPTFLRFMRGAKISESEGLMKKMSDGAKVYFSSEQRFSEPGGAEPWHPAGAGSSAAGLPVPFPQYVFPGADIAVVNTSEPECTGGAPGVANAPQGGKKQIPCAGIPAPNGTPHAATINKLRIDVVDPIYFKYYYQAEGAGALATATVTATANFELGGAAHTAKQLLSVGTASQEVFVGPISVTNEFE